MRRSSCPYNDDRVNKLDPSTIITRLIKISNKFVKIIALSIPKIISYLVDYIIIIISFKVTS